MDEAFLVLLVPKSGTATTLWCGTSRHLRTIERFIDEGYIKKPGVYMISLTSDRFPTSHIKLSTRMLTSDIFTVSYNDHGELIYSFGFNTGVTNTVDPRRIHRWPH